MASMVHGTTSDSSSPAPANSDYRAREANPEHLYYDVKTDPIRMEEMLRHSRGQRQVPVIVTEDRVTIGFGGT